MAAAKVRIWLLGLAPLVLLGLLLAVIVALRPAEELRGAAPPVEILAFQRVKLTPDGIVATVLNDGPDPIRIAQVLVDEAYWSFQQRPGGELGHLDRAELWIPYPWVEGEAHELRVITATGVTFDHEIPVAVETPQPSWRLAGLFALVGLYVGVLPVLLGLLWYPTLGRIGRRGLDFVLALTVGLLLFLLIDTTHEGLEVTAAMAGSLQGVALFVGTGVLAYLGIEAFGAWLKSRRSEAESAWVVALLVAVGIGLHNFGEGLAIGGAFALGEAALGTLLIIGFTLHNTTEGVAIVAPLAQLRVGIGKLGFLGLIAGGPTILGAWLGGFLYSPAWSVVFLAVGAGAIAQVMVQIAGAMAAGRPMGAYLRSGPVMAGLAAGLAVMYVTGLLVA